MTTTLCWDLDGTLDSWTAAFIPLLVSIKQGGGIHVVVLTGIEHDGDVTPDDVQEKVAYLEELGYSGLYDQLVIVPKPVDEQKAQWCIDNDARALWDNAKKNLKALPSSCLGLLCWQTRE